MQRLRDWVCLAWGREDSGELAAIWYLRGAYKKERNRQGQWGNGFKLKKRDI